MHLINSVVAALAVANRTEDGPPTIRADLSRQRRSQLPEAGVRCPRPDVEGSSRPAAWRVERLCSVPLVRKMQDGRMCQ
jgi:hypothetical protein